MAKVIILVPARYESTRFPGKPLAPIDGLPMVVYCARNAIKTNLDVIVCTDSKEIQAVCNLYNIDSILTSECATGTDRVALAMKNLDFNYVINLQGDEPLIDSEILQKFIAKVEKLKHNKKAILNCVCPIDSSSAFDPNNVKCALVNNKENIQYFSRKALLNSAEETESSYFKQLGLYGMSKEVLIEFTNLIQGELEKAEKVELMRWLENKGEIKCLIVENKTISVDTPQDLVDAIDFINTKKI